MAADGVSTAEASLSRVDILQQPAHLQTRLKPCPETDRIIKTPFNPEIRRSGQKNRSKNSSREIADSEQFEDSFVNLGATKNVHFY